MSQNTNSINYNLKETNKQNIKFIKMPFYPQVWLKLLNIEESDQNINQTISKVFQDFVDNIRDRSKVAMSGKESVFSIRNFSPENELFYTHFSTKPNEFPYVFYPGYWHGISIRSNILKIYIPESSDETEMMVSIRVGPSFISFLLVDTVIGNVEIFESLDNQQEVDFSIYGFLIHAKINPESNSNDLKGLIGKDTTAFLPYSPEEIPNLYQGYGIIEKVQIAGDFFGEEIFIVDLKIATFTKDSFLVIPMMVNQKSVEAKIEQGKQIAFLASIYGIREKVKKSIEVNFFDKKDENEKKDSQFPSKPAKLESESINTNPNKIVSKGNSMKKSFFQKIFRR